MNKKHLNEEAINLSVGELKEGLGYRVLIIGNKCHRCLHTWRPVDIDVKPSVCPKCKNPYWDRPRKEKKK